MQQLPGTRILALVVTLALGSAGSALAQDTTETGRAATDTTQPGAGAIDTAGTDTSAVSDTTDTSTVQNPPGYRGMERDTTVFPSEGGPPATPDQVEEQTTGTYEDSAGRDTSGAEENPAGYRGMEQPSGDSAAGQDTTTVGDTEPRQDAAETERIEPSTDTTAHDH